MKLSTADGAVSAAYDAVAPAYDSHLEADDWMRCILRQRYVEAFRPGDRVLDVGCGTGTDAVFLAKHGIRVTAVDVSAGMTAQARAKAARHGLADMIQINAMEIGDLSALAAARFDGIISSFAALNTLPTLDAFAAEAGRLLLPHGRLIVHLLNRSSLWEWAGLAARGRWADARRLSTERKRVFLIGRRPVVHYMPRAAEAYARSFAPHFRLCRAFGLGITRPPRPIPHVPNAALEALARLDVLLGPHRPFLNWGRFVVLEMELHTHP